MAGGEKSWGRVASKAQQVGSVVRSIAYSYNGAGQLTSIAAQQADRDYRIAEFYRRTGHPGSSYFYFELVRRRYPGSSYATSATTKMNEIRGEVEKHLKNTYLRQVQAPVGVNPVLRAWMELN